MTKLLQATYEHGQFIPNIPLNLPEHQKVLLAVVVNQDDTPGLLTAKLAEQSKSFDFLNAPDEDIYSPLFIKM